MEDVGSGKERVTEELGSKLMVDRRIWAKIFKRKVRVWRGAEAKSQKEGVTG